MGRIEYLYDYWLNSSTIWPHLDYVFEIFQQDLEANAEYEAKAFKPERYLLLLKAIKGTGVFGSSICIVFNTILIIAILSSKETRNLFLPNRFSSCYRRSGPWNC